MKLTVNGLKIEIDLYDLYSELPREQQLELAHHLALEGEIVLQVAELLTTGQTANGSWTGHCSKDDEEKARVMLVERQKGVAAEVLKDVMNDRNSAQDEANRMSEWAWKLYHTWPDERWSMRPDIKSASMEDWHKRWVSKEQAAKLIE
jgi:hypothetical protein